jgi:hypothetical protein
VPEFIDYPEAPLAYAAPDLALPFIFKVNLKSLGEEFA